jgi:hypothetical protein
MDVIITLLKDKARFDVLAAVAMKNSILAIT